MKTKNQHFVPQTYLRTFGNNSRNLWVYDKATKRSFRSSIKTVASGEYFYDHEAFDKAYGDAQWFEKKFAVLESHYPINFEEASSIRLDY